AKFWAATYPSPLVSTYFRLECRDGLRRKVDGTLGNALLTREVQGVAQPILVVALFEVFTSVSTTGLGPGIGCDCSRFGHFQQVLQLKRFDARSIEGLALVIDLDVGDTLAQVRQLSNTLLHVFAGTEYTEVVLHAVLQLFTQRSHVFTGAALVDTRQASEGSIDIARAGATRVDAFFQSLFQVNAGGTTEHHQVKQR